MTTTTTTPVAILKHDDKVVITEGRNKGILNTICHTPKFLKEIDSSISDEFIATRIRLYGEVSASAEPAMLTADYNGKSIDLAKKAEERKNAPKVSDGDIVEVEGKLYKLRINMKFAVCDPIKFIPVEG